MSADDLVSVYRKFSERQHTRVARGPEVIGFHSYELCTQVSECRFSVPMVGWQVASDLRELVNCQNSWVSEISKWRTWMSVLGEYGEDARWDIRREFVNGVARGCMLEPSAMRDRVLRGLHFALHHANITVVPGYKDELPEDARARKNLQSARCDQRARYRARHDLTESVDGLARHWVSGCDVLVALEALDSESYRETSMDYRNAASHNIAPHFEQGVVPYVSREIAFASMHVPRADGRLDRVDDRSRYVVRYGFGERPALKLEHAFAANRLQLAAMRNVMVRYEAFLIEVMQRLSHRGIHEK